MFRARFNDVFPKSLPQYGPQDIERGVADATPGDHIERFLCALIGLVLNRKKEVEYGAHPPVDIQVMAEKMIGLGYGCLFLGAGTCAGANIYP